MADQDRVVSLSQIKLACKNCSLHQLCLPLGISEGDLDRLEQIISRKRPIRRGEHLYSQGEPFRSIYAVRTGSVKLYTIGDDGTEQVNGFYLPGELVGLEGVSDNHHPSAAQALETTSVCEIPFQRLDQLIGDLPSLRHQVLRIMGREIRDEHNLLMLLGKKDAEAKLAAFLLSLSNRFNDRGFSPAEFRLSMTRSDVGNYLGLAVETISRLLGRFHDSGILTADGKLIRVHDLATLRRLAGECAGEAQKRPHQA